MSVLETASSDMLQGRDSTPFRERNQFVDHMLALLADQSRRSILALLTPSSTTSPSPLERRSGEIAHLLGLSAPATSEHLRLLAQAGLVSSRHEGANVYYRLCNEPIMQAFHALVAAIEADYETRRHLGYDRVFLSLQQRDEHNDELTFHVRIQKYPLTPSALRSLLATITTLVTTCWLLGHERITDLLAYAQTYDERFVQETGLRIISITYNTASFKARFSFDARTAKVREALMMILDGMEQWQQGNHDERRHEACVAMQEHITEEQAGTLATRMITHMLPDADDQTKTSVLPVLLAIIGSLHRDITV